MPKICPSCEEAELEELVPGIKQCPNCNKIFKDEEEKVEEGPEEEKGMKEGEFWMNKTGINRKYEIAEEGKTVFRNEGKRWVAVLLCHSASLKSFKYIRISWFKGAINKHGGMFKIQEFDEIENVIIALERIDANFDDTFKPKDKISFEPIPSRKDIESEKVFDEKKRICPGCKKTKMKKARNKKYYECVRCGEIIVLQDGKPIYNVPNKNLPLSFTSNFHVNYYIPDYGITTHFHIANWKAIVIIHSKDNPNKRWLRFYWWQRNLQSYIKSKMTFGADEGLKWKTKRGLSSPNIYEKRHIRGIIEALYEMRDSWAEKSGFEPEEIKIPEV